MEIKTAIEILKGLVKRVEGRPKIYLLFSDRLALKTILEHLEKR